MSDQSDRPVGSRILIVEDEIIVAEHIALSLQDLGYHIVGKVSSGEEAIQLTEELKPDLVLMDIMLAGEIDGIQAAEEVRVRSDIPIIFVTAHRDADLISRAKVTEPYGFLAKPVSRNVLKTKIEMVLYKHAADKRVRESEERYRTLVEQSIDGISLFQGTTIRFANRALARMFGCQNPEEMIGQNFLTFVALEDRAVMEKGGLDLEAEKSVTDYHQFKALRKDGTTFDAELRASLTTYRGDKVRQGIIRDVTVRKRAEDVIRQGEARKAKAEELAGLFSWELNIETGRLVQSEGSYRTYGFHSGITDLNLDSFMNAVHPDDRYLVQKALGNAVDGVRHYDVEYRIVRADGEERVLHSRGEIQRNENGLAIRMLGMSLDITERKLIEKELRVQTERFQMLSDSAPFGMVMIAEDGTFEYTNPKFKEILGYDLEDAPNGREWMRKVFPDDAYRRQVVAAWFNNLKKHSSGEARPAIFEVTCNDGRRKILDFRPVKLSTGEDLMTCEDITERMRSEEEIKKAQAALRESEERYRAVFDNAGIGIDLVDPEGKFIQANNALMAMLGYTDKEFHQLRFSDITHPDDREASQQMLDKVMRGGMSTYRLEKRYIKKDESYMWGDLSVSAIRDLDGKHIATIGVVADITDRKRTEEALRESESRFREFAEAIPQIVYEHDFDGKLIFLNRSGRDLVGCRLEDLGQGIKLTDFVAHEDRARFLANLRKELQGESVPGTEYTIVLKNATRVPVMAYSSPVMRDDKVLGLRGVWVDVSILKQAEDVLKRSRDSLERLVAERTADLEFANEWLRKEMSERISVQESLAESEGRLRGIFETSTDCVFIKDLSFRYTLVNSAMCSLLDSTEAQIVGKTDAEIFGLEAAERLRSADDRVAKGEVLEESQVLPVKGALLTFLTVKTPLTDSSGKIVGICGISRNVTERRVFQEDNIPASLHAISAAMKPVLNIAHLSAATDSTILITGESGTGKDYLAGYIHGLSRRSSGPYYSINCASIPRDLAESELFGHEAGAFTGAAKKKRGLLELAEGGTVLLNEIAELPPDLQAKLLAFLDTRTFTRIGGEKSVAVDLRLIAATNRNLSQEIAAGRFRADLFYRLNVISIGMPPLRERLDDLPGLVEELVERLGRALGFSGRITVEPRVINTMRQYPWPGNIRELRNVLERALIISRGGPVRLHHLRMAEPKQLEKDATMPIQIDRPLPDIIAEIERTLVGQALQRAGGNQQQAANQLGISRYTLARHIKKCGISSFRIE